MKRIYILLFLIFFPFVGWAQAPGVRPEEIVTLIISANVFGEYEPCG